MQKVHDKGHSISKGLYGVTKSTKKTTFFIAFLPLPLKRGLTKKIKALYSTYQGVFSAFFLDWTSF
jgi:hypothetical protein